MLNSLLLLSVLVSVQVAGPPWLGLPAPQEPARLPAVERVEFLPARPVAGDPRAAAREVFAGAEFALLREQAPSQACPRRVLLERTVDGYPVAGEVVRVNWLRDGTVLVTGALAPELLYSGFDAVGAAAAAAAARRAFAPRWPMDVHEQRLEILPLAGGARLCRRVDLVSAASDAVAYSLWVDAQTGALLAARDLVLHHDGAAAVFVPNPVQVLDDPRLRDHNDSGTAVPAAGYAAVVLRDLDGSGFVQGRWATTQPTDVRAHRPNLDFTASRAAKVFEEANAYYAVDGVQRHLQSLGIQARRTPQRLDVYDKLFGVFEYPNASYNPATKVMSFGTMGVDFAEDGDVVVHEYGHAIHDEVQGGIGGGENGAMSEGYSDFLACSWYDDALLGEWVGTWLGGHPYPMVRRADNLKHYPEDLNGNVHDDGELWCGALWESAQMVGYDLAAVLAVEGMAMQATNTGMRAAARFLLEADRQLYAGAHLPYLAGALGRAGLVDLPPEQALLWASSRRLSSGSCVAFELCSPGDAGAAYLVVLSNRAVATPTGPPFNTTLDIDIGHLSLSGSLGGLAGRLNANGCARFALPVPRLPWKTRIYAQAMVLGPAGVAVRNSTPSAFRAERH